MPRASTPASAACWPNAVLLDQTCETEIPIVAIFSSRSQSTALTISSTTFLASPNTIMVLSM